MADEKYTRCPGCRTVFRVTPAQLALRSGQVRCGHCRTVFDGTANLIRLARPGPAYLEEDANTGPLTVTLRRFARNQMGNKQELRLQGIKVGRRWAILLSDLDITSGLVGQNVDGINGYSPATATDIASRIILNTPVR